jgi:hypothetical protein
MSETNAICSTGALVTVPGSPVSLTFNAAAKMAGGLAFGISTTKWLISGDINDRNTAILDLVGLGVGNLINRAVAPSTTISVGQSELLENVMGNSANVISFGMSSGFHL